MGLYVMHQWFNFIRAVSHTRTSRGHGTLILAKVVRRVSHMTLGEGMRLLLMPLHPCLVIDAREEHAARIFFSSVVSMSRLCVKVTAELSLP